VLRELHSKQGGPGHTVCQWWCKGCCAWGAEHREGCKEARQVIHCLPCHGWGLGCCDVFGCQCHAPGVGGGGEGSGGDKGFGENVSGEERLMDLGSSSGNTYALLEV